MLAARSLLLLGLITGAPSVTSAQPVYGPAELEHDITAALPALELCRANRVRAGERAVGRMAMHVVVQPSGALGPTTVITSSTRNARLTSCIEAALASAHALSFPAAASGFTFTLTFTPRGTTVGFIARAPAAYAGPRETPRVHGEVTIERAERLGDAPAPPEVGGADGSRVQREAELDLSIVDAAVRRALSVLRRCYDAQLAVDPTHAGRIVFELTVVPEGNVTPFVIIANETGSPELGQCLQGSIGRSRFFPGPERAARFRFALRFTRLGAPPSGASASAAPASQDAPHAYEDEFTAPPVAP